MQEQCDISDQIAVAYTCTLNSGAIIMGGVWILCMGG